MKPQCRSSLPSPLFTACPQPQSQKQQALSRGQNTSNPPPPGAPPPPVSSSSRNGVASTSILTGSSSSSSSSDSDSSDNNNGQAKSGSRPKRRHQAGIRARVLFNFEASGPGELSVTAGQPVRALYHVDRRWLFVLTRSGQVGYIPFLYATKETWAACQPVPSMRRYCRGFSPRLLSSPQNSSSESAAPADQRLCLPADLSRPPAMVPAAVAADGASEERLCSSAQAESGRRVTRPSSLRLEQPGAGDGRADRKAENTCRQRLPPALSLERPRRSSFDSAVTSAASPAVAKRRVTFRPEVEIIGTADNIDRQPVYQQLLVQAAQSGAGGAGATEYELEQANGEVDCVLQTLV